PPNGSSRPLQPPQPPAYADHWISVGPSDAGLQPSQHLESYSSEIGNPSRFNQAMNRSSLPDHELDAVLRRETGDIQHAAGSCRMSGVEDVHGVVNPDGGVKGIAGLRVADASIMPSDCRANTHFTTVVIGEAIARMMMR
ncbi:GMC family oxidoreductase, partial [Bradyrhizobium liaoningense]